jgi:hypothetical protein
MQSIMYRYCCSVMSGGHICRCCGGGGGNIDFRLRHY